MSLEILARLAATIHGGTLFSAAMLLLMRRRLAPLTEVDAVRAFRSMGATLGVTLGLFILGEATAWPGRVNPGASGLDAWAVHPDQDGLRLVIFGAYWVSYVALEIWTLEPCRLLDRAGQIADPIRYAGTAARVARHLAVNALLFLTVVALGR